ncbi:hypothetical protein ACFQ49_02770 [Kroppenstedtia eburnea]|uniref:hypothetical protein n=1 Tax=Kroppenstedtia eburnea TaxID=714067 RepID=UPI0036330265
MHEFQSGIGFPNTFGIGLVHSEMESLDGFIVSAKSLHIKAHNPTVISVHVKDSVGTEELLPSILQPIL